MGGKAPSPPDPRATADAQAKYNKEAMYDSAAINQVRNVSPFGSETWSGEIGEPDRTRTITLHPAEQQALDSNRALKQGLLDTAGSMMPRVASRLATPFSVGGLPGVRGADGSTWEGQASPAQAPAPAGGGGKGGRPMQSASPGQGSKGAPPVQGQAGPQPAAPGQGGKGGRPSPSPAPGYGVATNNPLFGGGGPGMLNGGPMPREWQGLRAQAGLPNDPYGAREPSWVPALPPKPVNEEPELPGTWQEWQKQRIDAAPSRGNSQWRNIVYTGDSSKYGGDLNTVSMYDGGAATGPGDYGVSPGTVVRRKWVANGPNADEGGHYEYDEVGHYGDSKFDDKDWGVRYSPRKKGGGMGLLGAVFNK